MEARSNPGRLREAVRRAYSRAASAPDAKHPFPVGRDFAASLGYPAECLARVPQIALEAFTGVSNVSIYAQLPRGARVLDLGCGAGLDSLVAADRVGPGGCVIGVDFSAEMLDRAARAARQAGARNLFFCRAAAEALPVKTGSIDIALVNGIFNLNPFRTEIFSELARVMRNEGSVYGAELILAEALPADAQASEENWFA